MKYLRPHDKCLASYARIRTAGLLNPLLLLMVISFFGGCVSANPQHDVNYHPATDEISELNEKILARAQMNSNPSDYLLGEGDLLRISVFEAEELDTTVRVNSRGFVTLPLAGRIQIKGLTAIEAEKKIENLYQKGFIRNPHVSMFVEEHLSQRITLVGQFKNPGTYEYHAQQRLLDVIAMGGGLSEKAGQIVQVRRTRHVSGQPDTFIVDIDRLVTEGQVQLNIKINGGDVLFVPEAGVFFVDGAVRRPGAYPIKHKTVVQEGLVEAGGFETFAKKDRIKLVRLAKNGERTIIDLDLNKSDSKEMALKDRDILIVDASPVGRFFNNIRMHIGIPGSGISF